MVISDRWTELLDENGDSGCCRGNEESLYLEFSDIVDENECKNRCYNSGVCISLEVMQIIAN